VVGSEANLQKLKSGGTSDTATLQLKVAQAQAEVDRLQASLDQSTSGVAAAQAKLDAARNPDPNEVRQAVEAANQARATLAKVANADPHAVAGAVGGVDEARAQLEVKTQGPKETDLAVAIEQVRQAELNVKQAELDLQYANLTAPFDGIVAAINANPGEQASAGAMNLNTPAAPLTSLVTLVDPSEVRVDANVDEADIAKLAVGKPAEVTFDALPDRRLQGQIAAISPSGSSQQGVVTYPVAVNIEVPSGTTLPPGLTTALTILVDQKEAVLVVPSRAIRRLGREQTVEVVVGDRTETRTIRTGLANDQLTEVVAGLGEGEVVLVPGSGTAPVRVPGGPPPKPGDGR
jgi:RND family efflux transporter MFP subunit